MSIDQPTDVPTPWRTHFDAQGIEFTFRALERRIGSLSISTVVRALTGTGQPTRRVATLIADALGITEDEFEATRRQLVPTELIVEPFRLPQRADSLTRSERATVLSVIDAILTATHTTTTSATTAEPGTRA